MQQRLLKSTNFNNTFIRPNSFSDSHSFRDSDHIRC